MPPSNQGSRGALVTWTVITSIASVAAVVMAVVFYAGRSRAQQDYDKLKQTYSTISRENTPERGPLTEARAALGLADNTPLLDVAVTQRNNLAAIIGGGTATPASALNAANAAMKDVKSNGQAVTNLVGLINTLKAERDAANLAAKKAADDLTAANTAAAAAKQAFDASIAQMQQAVADANARAANSEGSFTSNTETRDQQFAELTAQMQAAAGVGAEAVTEASNRASQLQTQLTQALEQNKQLQDKLAGIRVPTQQVTRQADGSIIRIAGGDIVFIDLGQGDQITPGMTFEVYDRISGVPPIGSDSREDPQPKGKASIEVIRVQAGSSEARIVSKSATPISEGDIIANLIYDKNTRYNFVVHGSFDLDKNGVPTTNDTEVIKRFVTRFGGQLQNDVNVDTDFLVLGFEPKLPDYSDEDAQNDPILAARKQEAEQQLAAYTALRDKAIALNIPILNQNRFLYFVGYYQQAGR